MNSSPLTTAALALAVVGTLAACAAGDARDAAAVTTSFSVSSAMSMGPVRFSHQEFADGGRGHSGGVA